ncbi:MAG: hypothetical protein ACI8RY_001986 [Urechidicola sp.]|jgi:hypothetical protein
MKIVINKKKYFNTNYLLIMSFMIMILSACATPKKIIKEREISKVIYKYYYDFPANATISLDEYQDSLISDFVNKYGLNLSDEELKAIRILDKIKEVTPSEIHIEFLKDSILRYKTYDGITRTEIAKIEIGKGSYFLQKENGVEQINFFEGDSTYTIHQISQNDENILGYNCDKILINGCAQSIEEYPYSVGNSNFELHIAKGINLPLHIAIPINKEFINTFPLKARIWDSSCDGIVRVYEIKDILYK